MLVIVNFFKFFFVLHISNKLQLFSKKLYWRSLMGVKYMEKRKGSERPNLPSHTQLTLFFNFFKNYFILLSLNVVVYPNKE